MVARMWVQGLGPRLAFRVCGFGFRTRASERFGFVEER